MITPVDQRWREHRTFYRPAGEPIDTRLYEVAPIPDDRTARAFIEQHHYEHSYVAARFRFGLYWGGLLVGVLVFSVPMQGRVLDVLPCPREAAVELGRLVLLDRVPANGESWTIARCFELLRREGIEGIVSFSDPMPRDRADGTRVFAGHIGNCYQASNAAYLGLTDRRTVYLLSDGTLFNARAISKIRARERGWRYASERLVRAGAAPLGEVDDALAWLATWLPRLSRTIRHTGRLRYAFGLDKAVRRALAKKGQRYPKFTAAPRDLPMVGRAA